MIRFALLLLLSLSSFATDCGFIVKHEFKSNVNGVFKSSDSYNDLLPKETNFISNISNSLDRPSLCRKVLSEKDARFHIRAQVYEFEETKDLFGLQYSHKQSRTMSIEIKDTQCDYIHIFPAQLDEILETATELKSFIRKRMSKKK